MLLKILALIKHHISDHIRNELPKRDENKLVADIKGQKVPRLALTLPPSVLEARK